MTMMQIAPTLGVLALLLVVGVGVLVFRNVRVIQQYERGVVYRFGRVQPGVEQ
jgi:regulator of protease activity HflC (stomatin/prohibitin superfamily)